MEWIRKRARWPRIVALLVLFGLTVTAPQCWRWLRAHRVAAPEPSEASDSAPGELVRIDPPSPAGASYAPALPLVSDKGPALPPIVTPQIAGGPRFGSAASPAASLAEPLLEDAYALVDDPLPAADGRGRQLANQVETMPSMAPLATSGGSLWRQPAATPTAPQPPMAPGGPQAVRE